MLSQNKTDHGKNFRKANRPPFNEAGHHRKVNDHGLIGLGLRRLFSAPAAGVLFLFFDFPFRGSIVGSAPFNRFALAPGLPASEGAIDIVSIGISRMGQKENAAVPASLQAGPKVGKISNNTSNLPKIEGRYLPNAFFSIPVRREPEKELKSYDKKAKSWLVWLMKSDIPSFSFHVFGNS